MLGLKTKLPLESAPPTKPLDNLKNTRWAFSGSRHYKGNPDVGSSEQRRVSLWVLEGMQASHSPSGAEEAAHVELSGLFGHAGSSASVNQCTGVEGLSGPLSLGEDAAACRRTCRWPRGSRGLASGGCPSLPQDTEPQAPLPTLHDGFGGPITPHPRLVPTGFLISRETMAQSKSLAGEAMKECTGGLCLAVSPQTTCSQ